MPGYKPTEITLIDGTVAPNATLVFRIGVQYDVNLQDEPLTVTTNEPSAFVNLPLSIAIPPGVTTITVTAVMTANPPSAWNIDVTCNDETQQYTYPAKR